jgi:pimeloyl-ACP methyl ester carboxylesterase
MTRITFFTGFILVLLIPVCGWAQVQNLHVAKIEEIQFATEPFEIVGNLYLASDSAAQGVVIWVHGSGPDQRTNTFPGVAFFNAFLDHGFAFFRYDKPGNGDSKGAFTDSLLFKQRAAIVNHAIDVLKTHPLIDSSRIGLAGSSQAGYVLPLVLSERQDVAFMVGISLPAQNGHEQWAYLLKMQLIHEGYPEEEAAAFSRMHLKMINASSKDEFMQCVDWFKTHPVNIPAMKGYNGQFADRLVNWWPLELDTADSVSIRSRLSAISASRPCSFTAPKTPRSIPCRALRPTGRACRPPAIPFSM